MRCERWREGRDFERSKAMSFRSSGDVVHGIRLGYVPNAAAGHGTDKALRGSPGLEEPGDFSGFCSGGARKDRAGGVRGSPDRLPGSLYFLRSATDISRIWCMRRAIGTTEKRTWMMRLRLRTRSSPEC